MKQILVPVAAFLMVSCAGVVPPPSSAEPGRLAARPQPSERACSAGEERLAVSSGRDAYLYVPASAGAAPPFLLFLHGAGGSAGVTLGHVRPFADRYGMIMLVPASAGETWDAIRGEPGVDVARVDEALRAAFARCSVDRRRLAVGGFSDGASYALTLGVANGDLFSHVVAFSPCGVSRSIRRQGAPAVFISHGRQDPVLPIAKCGGPLASGLRKAGFAVRFDEFEGKHEIPENIALGAFSWFTGIEPQAP